MVVVNSATVRTTRRTVPTTAGRGTTKAPTKQSAYAYLRSIRGKKSCASGSCPFWERHGRSFVSLRCYAEQYQECVCLHRMCFSSCMFSRQTCNQEMVSCLKQICPRCMPATQTAMCSVYDSMAGQVAQSLSAFACYPCCPSLNNNNTTQPTNGITVTTTKSVNGPTRPGTNTVAGQPGSTTTIRQNGSNRPTNINSTPSTNTNKPSNSGNTGNGRPSNSGNTGNSRPSNSGNTGNSRPSNSGNTGNSRPSNSGNAGSNQGGNGIVFPGNGNLANAPVNAYANNPSQNQRAKQTTRRVMTTRRITTTTRRAAPVKAQKKPESY